MIDLMLAMVAPHICSGCGELGSILCSSCANDIENDDFGRCVWCLRPTAGSHQCQACAKHYGTTGAWTVGDRAGTLKRLIDDYKFESRREAARQLAQLLAATIPSLPEDTVITWVPTAPSHVRQRGFDHMALIAHALSKQTGLTSRQMLARKRSYSQHELSRSARLKAVNNAFTASEPYSGPVLVIDDVLTTGATLAACAKVLRASGVEQLYVATIARQPKNQ